MIRQTWYETAKKNLNEPERLRFYEICLEYEFFDILPNEDAPFAARLLFDMVKNDIDNDKEKIRERAERARSNGAAGGRPKNKTESNDENENPKNPVGFSGSAYTLQYTKTNNTTKQDFMSSNEDTHAFFCCCLVFFDRGASDPVGEGETFWNYYEARGWKTTNGAEVVDRVALARAWRVKDCSALAMKKRLVYSDLMHKAHPTEPVLLSDFVECTRNNTTKKVQIKVLHQSTAILLDNKYLQDLRRWMPVDEEGKPFELEYSVIEPTFD